MTRRPFSFFFFLFNLTCEQWTTETLRDQLRAKRAWTGRIYERHSGISSYSCCCLSFRIVSIDGRMTKETSHATLVGQTSNCPRRESEAAELFWIGSSYLLGSCFLPLTTLFLIPSLPLFKYLQGVQNLWPNASIYYSPFLPRIFTNAASPFTCCTCALLVEVDCSNHQPRTELYTESFRFYFSLDSCKLTKWKIRTLVRGYTIRFVKEEYKGTKANFLEYC